jgi:hypothetical protein
MSADISNQKQTFFQPVDSPAELDKLFHSLIQESIPLQVKPKSHDDTNEKDLTILYGYNYVKTILLAKHRKGPQLPLDLITMVADFAGDKFFFTARVIEARNNEYVLNIEKVFRLQRRNNFRIPLPEKIIKADVTIQKIEHVTANNKFRVIDLSAGGFGMSVPPELVSTFEQGALFNVVLKIGNHGQLQLRMKIKYRRKITPYGFPMYFHFGCEFFEASYAINQQLAFLVNDCHRQIFSRMKT